MTSYQRWLIGMDAGTREFLRRLNEFLKAEADKFVSHEPYFSVNRDDDAKHGLVKVSSVLTVLHSMTAAVIFRSVPKAVLTHIAEFVLRPGTKFAARKAVELASRNIPSPRILLAAVRQLVQVQEQAEIEKALEENIRRDVSGLRKIVSFAKMFQSADRGKVRDVKTRHNTRPKKRMKKWHNR